MNTQFHNQKGFALITATILILAIGSITVFTILIFANNSAKNNRAITQGNQAKAMANACAELGIQRLITTPTYTGTTNQTIGSNSCSYTVTQPTASTSQITTTTNVGTAVRKTQITLTRSPLGITRWEEIP